ncbi:MAG: hypothetical protein WEA81_00700, partial [Dehalococcoidia bacterium]
QWPASGHGDAGGQMARRLLRARVTVVVVAGLLGFVLATGVLAVREVRAGDRFDLVRWEIETFPNRWLGLVGAPFRGERDPDEVLAEYFALDPGDPARRVLENQVERIVEGRIDTVLHELHLSARLALPGTVFPPVDLELATSPQVLVTSPREVIERRSTDLLRADLDTEAALTIERDAEADDGGISALVVGSGGVATYPAIVSDRTSYFGVLATSAHEWVHHYLAFYPLGFRYAESGDLRTINETVADLVGEEVARIVYERWGDPTPGFTTPAVAPATTPSTVVDRSQVLRDLRLEVDALLEDARVAEAEQRMEEVRRELEEAGIYIRRINQAFFAWFGTYAARPDATDPLGGYLREIRERSGSLDAFLANVRDTGSREDVVGVLERLGGAAEGAR